MPRSLSGHGRAVPAHKYNNRAPPPSEGCPPSSSAAEALPPFRKAAPARRPFPPQAGSPACPPPERNRAPAPFPPSLPSRLPRHRAEPLSVPPFPVRAARPEKVLPPPFSLPSARLTCCFLFSSIQYTRFCFWIQVKKAHRLMCLPACTFSYGLRR